MNIYVTISVVFIVLMSIVIIIYNTIGLMQEMKGMEYFKNYTTCKTKKKCNIEKPMGHSYSSKFHDFKHTKEKHPLHLYGFITESYSDEFLYKLQDICYTTYQEFNATSTFVIYEKIADDISKTKTKISCELINDPIYTIIFQDDDCLDAETKFVRLLVIYPKYKSSESGMIYANTTTDRLSLFFRTYVKNKNTSRGTICTLNKNHKMYYNLIQKNSNMIL
jgi:hypothetical protein